MNQELKRGNLLIADPFLKDPNFSRTVVLLCEYSEDGAVGFVLNRKYKKNVGELVSKLETCSFPVYYGGPVQEDTIHFLHSCPELIPDGMDIGNGIFWGGDFDVVTELLQKGELGQDKIRFYIGYSGWGEEQLEGELEEKTWLITEGNQKLVFQTSSSLIWQDSLKQLGGQYEQLIHYPLDPQLN